MSQAFLKSSDSRLSDTEGRQMLPFQSSSWKLLTRILYWKELDEEVRQLQTKVNVYQNIIFPDSSEALKASVNIAKVSPLGLSFGFQKPF